MTDLSKAREFADPWGGTEKEWTPEAVRQWGRHVANPQISIGLPGMYFTPGQDEEGRQRIFKTARAPEGAATIDPMMGLITEAQALSAARGIMRSRFSKWSPKNWGKSALVMKETRAIEQLDMEDLIKQMPEGLWARIKSFGRTARHPTGGTKYSGLHTTPGGRGRSSIWVNPHGADPASVMTHEVAHEASDAFLEWSARKYATGQKGAFAKLRKEWGEVASDMRYLTDSAPGINKAARSEMYNLNPDEIFANRFSEALNEGANFNEAVKFGAQEVRANLSRSRELVNRLSREASDRSVIKGIAF